jgi:hypothetical protein
LRSSTLQVGWWILYGYWSFQEFQRVFGDKSEDLDCFLDLGAYKICGATQELSIYSSLLMLMTQALASRIFLPGVSNFVNASVRRFALPARCVISFCRGRD